MLNTGNKVSKKQVILKADTVAIIRFVSIFSAEQNKFNWASNHEGDRISFLLLGHNP